MSAITSEIVPSPFHQHNTFEQLCINYANERLQMLFNQAVFQQELLSYAEEGISTSDIAFDDNQPCIELFEQVPT